MRWIILVALIAPGAAQAQNAINPSLSRASANTDAIVTTVRAIEAARPATLASGVKKKDGLISKNESYNLSRAISGRVGIRVGNDMSFQVGK